MDRSFAAAKIDLFHATEHLLPPLTGLKTVFTFHDAIYALFPQYHLPLNRLFLGLMMPRFLRQAHAIIAVSECSKRDVMRLYSVDPARLHVIYEGVDPAFRLLNDTTELARVREKYNLPSRFILYFSTIEPRKNLKTLLEAFNTLLTRDRTIPALVIAGRKGWLYEPVFAQVRKLGLESRVHFTDWVAQEDAPGLLNAADIFAYPSLYEGFGLAPLEAMACGTPVICSNAASLPEVVGDAAILVDPRDVGGLAGALERVLSDGLLSEKLRAKGIAQAAKFSWERTARETLRVYESISN
jgi:glycosyltransferase involved in cell wall biosynthesis